MIKVRREKPGDEAAIYRVNEQAFGEKDEAMLVDALRDAGDLCLSLVAEIDSDLVGHIAFSPLYDDSGEIIEGGVALGPLAVLPEHQRKGVGSALVPEGLRICRDRGEKFCILLGSMKYYPRFGFEPALPKGIWSQFDKLNKDLQVVVLAEPGLEGASGMTRFAPAFDQF